jgi:hypothetical protein
MVVVALGEPSVPVTFCAPAGPEAVTMPAISANALSITDFVVMD